MSGYSRKRIDALAFWASVHLLWWIRSSLRERNSSWRRVSPFSNSYGTYFVLFLRCSFIFAFSSSIASHRCFILRSSIASENSFWTWKRSLTNMAPGNDILTILRIAGDRSNVTSFTSLRFPADICLRAVVTLHESVPRIIATSIPFFPFASLLVTIV